MSMVGAFAHELARLLVETFEEPPPGGALLHEPAIDLAAVFMGFGVFMANSTFEAARYDLNEGEFVHALALFCLLRKLEPESVAQHLNPHLRKYLRLASRDLAQHEPEFQQVAFGVRGVAGRGRGAHAAHEGALRRAGRHEHDALESIVQLVRHLADLKTLAGPSETRLIERELQVVFVDVTVKEIDSCRCARIHITRNAASISNRSGAIMPMILRKQRHAISQFAVCTVAQKTSLVMALMASRSRGPCCVVVRPADTLSTDDCEMASAMCKLGMQQARSAAAPSCGGGARGRRPVASPSAAFCQRANGRTALRHTWFATMTLSLPVTAPYDGGEMQRVARPWRARGLTAGSFRRRGKTENAA